MMSMHPPGPGAIRQGDADGSPQSPFVARYERDTDGKHWNVHIVSEPGCLTFGASLQEARRSIVDALALWLDLDIDNAVTAGYVVVDDVVVDDDLRRRVEDLRADRETIAAAQSRVASDLPALAEQLYERHWSMRAIAITLGISHQRVAQLINSIGRQQNRMEHA